MKKLFLSILIFSLFSFLHSQLFAAAPKWIYDVEFEYPKEKYIAYLGSGKTLENAQANALSQLALFFRSQVAVSTRASTQMTNKNDDVQKEQSLNQYIEVQSNVNLVSVEYSKNYYDRKTKDYYVVAYLDRKTAWQRIETELNEKFEAFENFQNLCETSSDSILKYNYSKKANSIGQEFIEESSTGFLINPSKRKEYKPKLSEINLKIEENSHLTIPVVLKVSGDFENIISKAVLEELKNFGISPVSSSQKNANLLFIEIKSNEKISDEIHSVFPEISISLTDSTQSKKYYDFSKKWGKTSAFSLAQAQKKSFLKIAEELRKILSDNFQKI